VRGRKTLEKKFFIFQKKRLKKNSFFTCIKCTKQKNAFMTTESQQAHKHCSEEMIKNSRFSFFFKTKERSLFKEKQPQKHTVCVCYTLCAGNT